MAEYTLDEMREQAVKAARYFAIGMEGFERSYIAVKAQDTVIVVARGPSAEKLARVIDEGRLGEVTAGVEDATGAVHLTGPKVSGGDPAEVLPAVSRAETQSGLNDPGGSPTSPPERAVVLIPQMHESSDPQFKGKGKIHLHVLHDAKLGRRERRSGEALCSKKHGSNERTPEDHETEMCGECVKVAADNGIAWSR